MNSVRAVFPNWPFLLNLSFVSVPARWGETRAAKHSNVCSTAPKLGVMSASDIQQLHLQKYRAKFRSLRVSSERTVWSKRRWFGKTRPKLGWNGRRCEKAVVAAKWFLNAFSFLPFCLFANAEQSYSPLIYPTRNCCSNECLSKCSLNCKHMLKMLFSS